MKKAKSCAAVRLIVTVLIVMFVKNDGYDSFNNVLKRADDAMYNDKSEYYKNNGGRRRSDRPQTEE